KKDYTWCLTAYSLTILLVATFMSNSWSAPQGHFQRRNWTPQAMLYLKGAQGRRFISEDRKEGDMYDRIQLDCRAQAYLFNIKNDSRVAPYLALLSHSSRVLCDISDHCFV
uniref:Spexin hormone n=1 Tax=Erpetoichthys calabaricus TaxID=27687 RepID=A0A8C4S6Q4_ERPCA